MIGHSFTERLEDESVDEVDDVNDTVSPSEDSACSPDHTNTGSANASIAGSMVLVHSPKLLPDRTSAHGTIFFDYMRTVFVPTLILPTQDRGYVEDFKAETVQVALGLPFLLDALLACSGSEMQINDRRHGEIARGHYLSAAGGLRRYLEGEGDYSPEAEIISLRTILMLCLYERSQLDKVSNVTMHLNGAAALVKSCFIRNTTPSRMDRMWHEMRILAFEAFVFHAATSVPFQSPPPCSPAIDEAFAIAIYSLQLGGHETSTHPYNSPILGAPARLFSFVRQVSLLHSGSTSGVFRKHACARLDRDLHSWSLRAVDSMYSSTTRRCDQSSESSAEVELDNKTLTVTDANQKIGHYTLNIRLYVLAARVLLADMMEAPATHLLAEAMYIVDHVEPSTDYYAEYYCWPFFCLGVSAVDKADRDLLTMKIMLFWQRTANGTLRKLMDMLRQQWGHD